MPHLNGNSVIKWSWNLINNPEHSGTVYRMEEQNYNVYAIINESSRVTRKYSPKLTLQLAPVL